MSSLSTARAPRTEYAAFASSEPIPDGFAQHKLTRLLELRAVIDAMRCAREAQDPLLAWVTSRDQA